jgi:hypothetical protein
MEVKGFLRRPQTLRPKFNLDIDIEEYIKQCRKHKYYTELSWNSYAENSINVNLNNNIGGKFLTLFDSYKNDNSVINKDKFNIIKLYNKLKNSEMYDQSVCKMHAAEIAQKNYLVIHFPKLFLSVVNNNTEPIEIRDIYFFIKDGNLGVFRTTFDINNPKFIHPHVNGNFGTYCLGNSPLSMSLTNLHYNLDTFNEDDADIFWVNFYRTVTQKTEYGDHYYALSKLDQSLDLGWDAFYEKVMSNAEFINSFTNYLSVHTFTEEIILILDKDAIKKDFFTLLSYDNDSKNNIDKKDALEQFLKIDDVAIRDKKLTLIYKNPRKLYNNINGLLEELANNICPSGLINKTYDDHKEKFKQSNNSGEQSVGQNQVFEFQML